MKNIENLYSSKPNHQPPAWEVLKPPISGEIGHCLHIIGLTTAEAPKNSPLIKVAPFFLALCRRKSSKTSRRTMPMYSSSWGTSKIEELGDAKLPRKLTNLNERELFLAQKMQRMMKGDRLRINSGSQQTMINNVGEESVSILDVFHCLYPPCLLRYIIEMKIALTLVSFKV